MNFHDREIFTDDRIDDYILPDNDQCVVKVVKRIIKNNHFLVLAPSGKIFEVSLSLKQKDFLHGIKPGHYVLIEGIPGTDKSEIVAALDDDTIKQYVYDKVWPPEFNPNITKFRVRKKQLTSEKQKIRRFKGLHSEKKYLAGYNRHCRPSSTSSSDNVPEGECETFPPNLLLIFNKHKRKLIPWYPPGRKPKNLNPNKTKITYLKKVAAKEIEKDDEYGLMMRRWAEWNEKGGKKPATKGSGLCSRLKRKLKKEVEQTKKRKHKKQDKSLSDSTETDSDSTYSSQTTNTDNSTIEDDKVNKTNIITGGAKTTDSNTNENKAIKTSEAKPTTSNIENDEAIETDSKKEEEEEDEVAKGTDSKKEDEKSIKTATMESGTAATTSKIEDDIAYITDICARGVRPTDSKCTPWGMLRSKKYKNKKITQEMIDNFIRDEVTKEQMRLIKKEKLRRALIKQLGEDIEISSSESTDSGEGSSSGEGEDTDEGKDEETKEKEKKEKEKKEKEKKEKEKKEKEKKEKKKKEKEKKEKEEKEKKKRQKMPRGCRTPGIKNREEIMRDT